MSRAIRGLTVAALIAAALWLPSASTGDDSKRAVKRCPLDALCVWAGKDYKGARLVLTRTGEYSNRIYNKLNDRVSSAKNRYEHLSYLYEHTDGGGQTFCIDNGQKIPDFSAFPDEFDNDASSSFMPETAQPPCP